MCDISVQYYFIIYCQPNIYNIINIDCNYIYTEPNRYKAVKIAKCSLGICPFYYEMSKSVNTVVFQSDIIKLRSFLS